MTTLFFLTKKNNITVRYELPNPLDRFRCNLSICCKVKKFRKLKSGKSYYIKINFKLNTKSLILRYATRDTHIKL